MKSKEEAIEHTHTRVKRLSDRGHYELTTINEILDAQVMCHISFVHEGRPQVIPTLYARDGKRVLFHGSALSRMLNAAEVGPEICFCVSILDAFVLARSAFHHSANYRSVILYGRPIKLAGEDEKREALRLISEHLLPGRWDECRGPSTAELKATTVLALPIEEGAAKIRAHGAKDDPQDKALGHWAGLLPIYNQLGTPIPAADIAPDSPLPASIGRLDETPFFSSEKQFDLT